MSPKGVEIVTSIGPKGSQTILRLSGPLNIHTVFEFQEVVRADASDVLIIDCTDVHYIDSAGLGALVGAYIGARRARRKFALAAANTQVKALIEMTQVNQLLPIYATVRDAETSIT